MSRVKNAMAAAGTLLSRPLASARLLARMRETLAADALAESIVAVPSGPAEPQANPLRDYFDAHTVGRGIWKWAHYFDIYQRHLARFRGTDVHLVEIGVFSGGSLDMWLDYLGPRAVVTGIDIAPECRAYAGERTNIVIGDQSDRAFWGRFRAENPRVDVLIDDGAHDAEMQRITLEEMLAHLRPGGVYLCEDVHGLGGRFAAFAHRLADHLNFAAPVADADGTVRTHVTTFQSAIASIHFYPFVVVIERTPAPVDRLVAERHGTEWQPFLG